MMQTSPLIRAFIAIKLPFEVTKALRDLQALINRHSFKAVSWTRPDAIHLTIKFLGEIDGSKIDQIGWELKRAASGLSPFTLSTEGVGGFPNLRHPRVVWVGIKENSELAELQKNIDERLNSLGFEKEDRPFHPHLTLCRIKTVPDGREIGKIVTELNPDIRMDFKVESFVLFKSILNPKGAEYFELKKIDLSSGFKE